MPIYVAADIRRMEEEEFKVRTYEVMRHVFDVQRELGRLLHEKIYQREIAFRVPDAQCEVAVDVRFEDFCKTYYLDLLVGGGAIFELKAVESLVDRHRRQLMHYLFLTGLSHGKLVNLRTERVGHEFVNNVLTRGDRTEFSVDCAEWEEIDGTRLKDRTKDLLADWGTGLDLGLYEEAAAYLCGQPPEIETDVEIRLGNHMLGVQRMRLGSAGRRHPHHRAGPGVARRSPDSSLSAAGPCRSWRDSMDQHHAAFGSLQDASKRKMREK